MTAKGEPKLFLHLTPNKCYCDGCKGIILKASEMSAFASHAPLPACLINLIASSMVA